MLIKSWVAFTEVAVVDPRQRCVPHTQFNSFNSFSYQVPKCKGLGILLLPDDHLLHHDGNLPGVDGEVVDDKVESSLGRLDFSTVGE